MIKEVLEINKSVWFNSTKYENGETDVDLEYIEHSSSHYHPDTISDVEIDKEKAVEIIEFLKRSFGI